MYEAQRERAILRTVAERHFVSVQDLTAHLSTSEATIRRDLRRLAEAGRLRRVRGGAQAIERPALAGQPQFGIDRTRHVGAKRAIARRAAALCEPGDAVIVDGGTTTFAMAEFLGNLGLQILTNSFPLAQELVGRSNNRILLPGGEIYREQQLIVGPYAQPTIEHFSGRLMFLSAQAIGPHGLMQTDPLLIQTELQLIARAEKLVALVDSSKFELRASLVLCPLTQIDVLITTADLSREKRALLAEAGIEILFAEEA